MTGKPRYGRIEALANSLLVEAGITAPPVPVEQIVKARGIAIQLKELGEVSGIVVRKDSTIVIGVNKGEAPTRRRFTIAHEFGHALLHRGEEVHFDKAFRFNLRSGASSIEETEANFFAACILMPRHFLETDQAVAQLDAEDPAAVAALARRYHVSPHAMSIRLGNLTAPRR